MTNTTLLKEDFKHWLDFACKKEGILEDAIKKIILNSPPEKLDELLLSFGYNYSLFMKSFGLNTY